MGFMNHLGVWEALIKSIYFDQNTFHEYMKMT
jgi:hypothetical protein